MLSIQKARFFLLWFAVVSACIYVGFLLILPLQVFIYELYYDMPYSPSNTDAFFELALAFLIAVGLFMGLGQWIVINTKIKKAHSWILATLIGFTVGNFVAYFLFGVITMLIGNHSTVFERIGMIGALAGAGLFTGFCQWIALKRRLTDSLKWSLVIALSYDVAILLLLVGSFSRDVAPIIFSVTIGLITGVFAEPLIIYSDNQNARPQEIAS